MPFANILLIAVGVAMDAFAVSIACGAAVKTLKARSALLAGLVFGVCQAAMPVLGWALGRLMYDWISAFDYWVAFGMLLLVGGHMILESLQPEDKEAPPHNPLGLSRLFVLGIATSIDALAVGIGLSMLRVSILTPVLTIGLVALVFSFAGVYFGRYFGARFGSRMEALGGLLLIGIGAKILVDHLLGMGAHAFSSRAVWLAFGLTLAAGLATGIGSLVAFFGRRTIARRFAFGHGVCAGMLLWIAFRHMLPLAEDALNPPVAVAAVFLAGLLVAALIDLAVPDYGNPHEPLRIERLRDAPAFRRTNISAIMAMVAHSFPEGLAVFMVLLHGPLPVAVGAVLALALHNIPEGISTALPIYHATGSRAKACIFSALTSLSEPLGALLIYTLFHDFMSAGAMGFLMAASAGFMVFVAVDGLLPAAREYEREHMAIYGVLFGMSLAALLGLL